jgi:hypothetical protein
MRKRLVGGLLGSILGLFAGILIPLELGLPPVAHRLAFTIVGLGLGLMATLLSDVFSGNTGFSSDVE